MCGLFVLRIRRSTELKILFMVTSLLLVLEGNAADTETPIPATVSVNGEGIVTVVPDMATITVGVVTQADVAADALVANTDVMHALSQVLDDFAVAGRDRQTRNFNISPQYRRDRNQPGPPEIESYRVSNQLAIRVRDLDQLGILLDALVKSGSNSVTGIQFGNSDQNERMDEARKLAVADARRRAAIYADAAGVGLGKVLSISEAGAATPRPMLRTAMMAEAAAVPVAAGENEIRAMVQVVFALE
jgi:uncharacterized protein YggE